MEGERLKVKGEMMGDWEREMSVRGWMMDFKVRWSMSSAKENHILSHQSALETTLRRLVIAASSYYT